MGNLSELEIAAVAQQQLRAHLGPDSARPPVRDRWHPRVHELSGSPLAEQDFELGAYLVHGTQSRVDPDVGDRAVRPSPESRNSVPRSRKYLRSRLKPESGMANWPSGIVRPRVATPPNRLHSGLDRLADADSIPVPDQDGARFASRFGEFEMSRSDDRVDAGDLDRRTPPVSAPVRAAFEFPPQPPHTAAAARAMQAPNQSSEIELRVRTASRHSSRTANRTRSRAIGGYLGPRVRRAAEARRSDRDRRLFLGNSCLGQSRQYSLLIIARPCRACLNRECIGQRPEGVSKRATGPREQRLGRLRRNLHHAGDLLDRVALDVLPLQRRRRSGAVDGPRSPVPVVPISLRRSASSGYSPSLSISDSSAARISGISSTSSTRPGSTPGLFVKSADLVTTKGTQPGKQTGLSPVGGRASE